MTSHTLARFNGSKDLQEDCAFCNIVAKKAEAHVVYEDEENIAFLDILPLRKGHTLVVPKKHIQQLSHLESDQAASLSKALVNTTRAVGKALDDERIQVITNQVYAQIVPHVHFHIVPASFPSSSPSSSPGGARQKQNPMALMGLGHGRDELDEDEAHDLVHKIRQAVSQLAAAPPVSRL